MQHSRLFPKFAQLSALSLFLLSVTSCSAGDTGTTPGSAWSVDFSQSSLTFTSMNATQSVTATVRDNKGISIPDASVSWTSDNPSVATVSGGGRTVSIVAKAPGVTNINAVSGSARANVIVTVLGVHRVNLSPSNVSLRIGDTQSLIAQVQADAGVPTGVTWTSSNTAAVTVSDAGVVSAVAPGSSTVTATSVADSRYKATAQVVVAPPTGIAVAPLAATLSIGETQAFSAIVALPPGQSTLVNWSSSNPSVATVSNQGVVTAVGVGDVVITAQSAADPTLVATAEVQVIPIVRSVSVSPNVSSLALGESVTLTANVVADPGLPTAVTWRTSNAAIATVSNTGVVSAVTVGGVTITAVSVADTNQRANATVSVASRPVVVSITQRNVALAPGASQQLTASVTGDPGISTGVTWSSNATGIATVSGNGLVTAVSGGAAIITARSVADPARSDTVTVTVSSRLANSWSATRLSGALYEDVISSYTVSPTEVYAVNLYGNIYRYDGVVWTKVYDAATNGSAIRAIHGISGPVIYAAGTNGKVFRLQGSQWVPMTTNSTATFNGVFVVTPTLVYAVGDNGAALRYNGVTWASIPTGSSRRLNAVWAVQSEAIAVGEAGEVQRFTGAAWQKQTVGTTNELFGVTASSPANVYIVGEFGTFVRYANNTWSNIYTGVAADLYGVAISPVDGTTLVTGSFGSVYRVNDNSLAAVSTPYPTRFHTAQFDTIGTFWTAGQRGIVQRFTNNLWNVHNLAPDLIDVWSTSPTNAWAVGEFGFVYHWNGAMWLRQEAPTRERLNTVWAADGSNAFAGGDGGVMLRYNGTNWSTMTVPTSNDILALYGTSASNVYAVTFGGEVLRYNGTSWSVVTTVEEPLYGVYGSGPNDVYVTGDRGTVLRFDGSAWTPRNVSSPALLVGLWAGGPTNVFTVGLSASNPLLGSAFQFNGSTWSTSALPAQPPELTAVWGTSSFDLYATGGAGTILRYNGASWSSMNAGTTDYLWSVTGAPDGSGGAFAVGYNGTVVAGSNGSASAAAAFAGTSRRPNFQPGRGAPPSKSVVPDGKARTRTRGR